MKNYIRRHLYAAHVAHQEILAEDAPRMPAHDRKALRSRRRLDFWLAVAHYFGA